MGVKRSFKCRDCGPIDDPAPCRARGHVVVATKKYATNNGVRKRCRCARRMWDSCPHVWRFNFHWKGEHCRGPLHAANREAARTEFARVRADIMAGAYVKAAPRQPPATLPTNGPPTFAAIAGQYAE